MGRISPPFQSKSINDAQKPFLKLSSSVNSHYQVMLICSEPIHRPSLPYSSLALLSETHTIRTRSRRPKESPRQSSKGRREVCVFEKEERVKEPPPPLL